MKCIATVSDAKFIPRATAMINSVKANSPGVDICIAMINPSEESTAQISSKGARPFLVFKELNSKPINTRPGFIYSDLMAFCANYKIKFIHELLNCEVSSIEQLIMMDADSIVRKDLGSLFDRLSDYDIIVKQREDMPDNHKIMAGVICVNNTAASRNFFATASLAMQEIGMTKWFTDQHALYEAFKYCKLKVGNLSDGYIDWLFNSESHIWVGKGNRKDNDQKYVQEEGKYS